MSEIVVDAKGRKLTVQRRSVLDQVRLLRAIGPAQSGNEAYVNIVTMAVTVSDIDGVPCPTPTNERMIDAAIERIGDEGFAALVVDLKAKEKAFMDAAEAAAMVAVAADPLAISESLPSIPT